MLDDAEVDDRRRNLSLEKRLLLMLLLLLLLSSRNGDPSVEDLVAVDDTAESLSSAGDCDCLLVPSVLDDDDIDSDNDDILVFGVLFLVGNGDTKAYA